MDGWKCLSQRQYYYSIHNLQAYIDGRFQTDKNMTFHDHRETNLFSVCSRPCFRVDQFQLFVSTYVKCKSA